MEAIPLAVGLSALGLGTRSIVKHHLGADLHWLPGFAPDQAMNPSNFGYVNNAMTEKARANEAKQMASKPMKKMQAKIAKAAKGLTRTIGKKHQTSLGTARSKQSSRQAAPLRRSGMNHSSTFDIMARGKDSVKVYGRDFLQTCTNADFVGAPAGEQLFVYQLNPLNIVNSRLSTLASLYERFEFKKATIHFSTATSMLVDGSFVAFFDRDVKDVITATGQDALKEAYAHAGVAHTPVTSDRSWSLPPQTKKTPEYYIHSAEGDDERISVQAEFILMSEVEVATETVFGNAFTSDPGTLWIEYEVDMFQSRLEIGVNQTGNGFMYLQWDGAEDWTVPTATHFEGNVFDGVSITAGSPFAAEGKIRIFPQLGGTDMKIKNAWTHVSAYSYPNLATATMPLDPTLIDKIGTSTEEARDTYTSGGLTSGSTTAREGLIYVASIEPNTDDNYRDSHYHWVVEPDHESKTPDAGSYYELIVTCGPLAQSQRRKLEKLRKEAQERRKKRQLLRAPPDKGDEKTFVRIEKPCDEPREVYETKMAAPEARKPLLVATEPSTPKGPPSRVGSRK
jgi:hypothetical protein